MVGGALTVVAAGIGSSIVVWDNHVGRAHVANNFDTKLDKVHNELKTDISRVESNVDLLLVKSVVTMEALDGDKKHLRKFLR